MSVATIVSFVSKVICRNFGASVSCVDRVLTKDRKPPAHCTGIDPWIGFAGDFEHPVAATLKRSFDQANDEPTMLPDWVVNMDGMTGVKYRSLINRLMAMTKNPRYLEIGSWKGSSTSAAMVGNAAKVTCIDNWSQFGGPRDTFFENVNKCLAQNIDFTCIEADYREVDYGTLGKFNIYLFDGPHTEEDQYHAVCAVYDALDETFILIVDDWNWKAVRQGTKRAIHDMELHIVAIIEVRTTSDNQHGEVRQNHSNWHNGYFLAVCQKRISVSSPKRSVSGGSLKA